MINEQPKEKDNSKIKIAIIVIMALVLVGGATYAIITGFTVTNGDYSYHTACFDVSYDVTNADGTSDITGTLMPSEGYIDGLSGSVSIGLDPDCNVSGEGNLYLNINNNESAATFIQTVEPHCENSKTLETMNDYTDESSCTAVSNGVWVTAGTALKYAVFEEGNIHPVSVGYINKAGQKINIHKKFNVLGEHNFDIYIWLDGYLIDNTYTGLSLLGTISADVSQVSASSGSFVYPILDSGMIPVTIADDGTVSTVFSNSSNWYNYDEKKWANVVLVDSGTDEDRLYDFSGNYTSATLNGATFTDAGLSFDGTDDYVSLPNIQMTSLSGFTVESEIIIDNYPSGKVDIISSYENGGFGIEMLADGIIRYAVYDTNSASYVILASDFSLELGKRYLLTGSYDGANIYMYINGVFISSASIGSIGDSSTFTALGCNPTTSGCSGQYFNGTIYSSRFYNKALSAEEISDNYSGDIVKDDLRFYYDFEKGNRVLYKETAGLVIPSEEILAYYVWIPRYKYKIWNTTGTSSPQTIDIVFERPYSSMLLGTEVGEYRTHPAFWWDDDNDGVVDSNEMLSGIWVGKFETSTDSTSTCYTASSAENCNNVDQSPRILPNVSPLLNQNISNQFQTSLKFAGGTLSSSVVTFLGSSTYGLNATIDSHMMKNSEWGAVAYLSHSQYGINSEVRLNNYNNNYVFKTGCGASEENGSSADECQIVYGSSTSYPQSTTGNITGIFDMSGGSYEYTMGVFVDSNGNPRSGYDLSSNSGFNGLLYDDTSYTEGIEIPVAKYYDKYTVLDSLNVCSGGICFGHALSETNGWYDDYWPSDFSSYPFSSYPWFYRGGGATGSGSINDGIFALSSSTGVDVLTYSWRSVIVNKTS